MKKKFILRSKTVPRFILLCIDLQKEYFYKRRPLYIADSQKVLKNVCLLLKWARKNKIHIVHVRHISLNPQDKTFSKRPFVDFMSKAEPENEVVITKHYPGAFTKTLLDAYLKRNKITDIIICGLTSFLCCDTTSRQAHSLGYKVWFIKDATASLSLSNIQAKKVHEVVCAIQSWYFAQVVSTNEALNSFLI